MDTQIPGFNDNLSAQTVTIPNGASVSEMVATQGKALIGIIMPAAWTTAHLGYKACLSGNLADMQQVYDAFGNPVKTVVVAGTFIAIPQSDTIYSPFLQLFSVDATDNTTPVAQGAARTFTLLFRKYLS